MQGIFIERIMRVQSNPVKNICILLSLLYFCGAYLRIYLSIYIVSASRCPSGPVLTPQFCSEPWTMQTSAVGFLLLVLLNQGYTRESYTVLAPRSIRPNTNYFAAVSVDGTGGDLQVIVFKYPTTSMLKWRHASDFNQHLECQSDWLVCYK